MNRTTSRQQLGRFLMARRAEVAPSHVGLPATGRRRVAGLRREEVAMRAAISLDYYTRLEKGRLATASPQVLASISEALLLTPDQRAYLFVLAGRDDAVDTASADAVGVHPLTQRLVDNLVDTAALVLDGTMHIHGWNALGAAFYTDFAAVPVAERNLVRLLFLHPEVRTRYVDWEANARDCVAFLRMDTAGGDDGRLTRLVEDLGARSDTFADWWRTHDVAAKRAGIKRFVHPVVGEVVLDWQFLTPLHQPELSVLMMSAPPGSPSHAAVRLLASRRAA